MIWEDSTARLLGLLLVSIKVSSLSHFEVLRRTGSILSDTHVCVKPTCSNIHDILPFQKKGWKKLKRISRLRGRNDTLWGTKHHELLDNSYYGHWQWLVFKFLLIIRLLANDHCARKKGHAILSIAQASVKLASLNIHNILSFQMKKKSVQIFVVTLQLNLETSKNLRYQQMVSYFK